MDSYVPNITEPPVPIPFGGLPISIAESLSTPHNISISNPLQLSDFPDTAQGAVTFQAFTRTQEYLSHGFHIDRPDMPRRDTWIALVSQILFSIHNSIHQTHGDNPFPNSFSNLSEVELKDFNLLTAALSSLDTFFNNRADDDSGPANYEICLRCLEECKIPIDKAAYESVLLSCSQNIHAAHRTIINDQLRTLTNEMNEWVSTRRDAIKSTLVDAVTTDTLASFLEDHDTDPRIVTWATNMKTRIQQTAIAFTTQTAIDAVIEPWASEALEGARARALAENRAFLTEYTHDQRALAEARAISDANDFYNSTLASLKAEAHEHAERDVAEYKSELKIKAEEWKELNRLDAIKRLPKDSSSKSITRTNRTKPRVDPTARPPSRAHSTSRSAAPSPESLIPDLPISLPKGRSPDQTTPRASPVVELLPTRTLTESALSLQPPPTDVSVGPPDNSQEAAMLDVTTSQMTPYTYPLAPSAFERQGPPPTERTSTDLPTSELSALESAIAAALHPLTSQFSVFSSRLDSIESRQASQITNQPYSPSAPAAIWAPNPSYPTHHIPLEDQGHELPQIYGGMPAPSANDYDVNMDSWFDEDNCLQAGTNPKVEPVPQDIEDLFRHFYCAGNEDLSSSQTRDLHNFVDDLESYFYDHFGTSPSLPLTDHVEHDFRTWRAARLQTLALRKEVESNHALLHPSDQPSHQQLRPTEPAGGSIKLFPDRPPSAPRITTINDKSNALPPPIPMHSKPSPGPWVVAKGPKRPKRNQGNVQQTFAQAARNAPNPETIKVVAKVADLSLSQLNTLSRDQLINSIEVRFQLKVQSRMGSKAAYVSFYLRELAKEAAIATAPAPAPTKPATRPRARPVITSDYTITRRPDAIATFPPKSDPAGIVRSLQRSIRQYFNGTNSPLTLLSGCWGSNLSHNFILTFAGKVDNNDILCIHKLLVAPFGPGASIVPQRGYTTVMVRSVPVLYHNDARQSPGELHAELEYNLPYQGLTIVSPPRWLRASLEVEKVHSSIVFAFLDEDGTKLPALTKNPLYLFGSKCQAVLFNSLPLVRECGICHRLNHSTDRCSYKNKNVTICYLCGGRHPSTEHHVKCPTAKTHKHLHCDCTHFCINCKAANLKSTGHVCIDTACPLRKRYRTAFNRTGASSEEETDRPMVVDQPIPTDFVPSSQPDDDDIVTYHRPSPARIDDTPPPAPGPIVNSKGQIVPDILKPYFANHDKWGTIDFSSLPLDALNTLPEIAHAHALDRGISIDDLKRKFLHA